MCDASTRAFSFLCILYRIRTKHWWLNLNFRMERRSLWHWSFFEREAVAGHPHSLFIFGLFGRLVGKMTWPFSRVLPQALKLNGIFTVSKIIVNNVRSKQVTNLRQIFSRRFSSPFHQRSQNAFFEFLVGCDHLLQILNVSNSLHLWCSLSYSFSANRISI